MHKELADLINRNVAGSNAVAFLAADAKSDSSITVEATHLYKVVKFLKTNKQTSFNSLHVISGVDYVDYHLDSSAALHTQKTKEGVH